MHEIDLKSFHIAGIAATGYNFLVVSSRWFAPFKNEAGCCFMVGSNSQLAEEEGSSGSVPGALYQIQLAVGINNNEIPIPESMILSFLVASYTLDNFLE